MPKAIYCRTAYSRNIQKIKAKGKLILQAITILLIVVLIADPCAIFARSQQCVRANPTVIIQPANQSGFAGQQLTYRVTVINNDSAGCPASSFVVMPSFPEAGFTHVPECIRLTLAPGQSGSRNVIIKSPPKSCSGPKLFQEVATNEWVPGFSGSTSAVYNVSSIGINCGAGFCIPHAPDRKAKQSLEEKIRRLIRGNQVPSALAAMFFQMARRFQLGLSPANSLEQRAFSIFQTLPADLQSILSCSVRTLDSLPPEDRDRLFAPEITTSATQPLTQDALARAVSNELLRRTSLQAYGDAECVSTERAGKARQQAGIDPGEIVFTPNICRVNGLRTNTYKPRLSLGEFRPEERQQVCELTAGQRLSCRDQQTPCPGNNRDGFCLRVPDVRGGEAVMLEGVNFFNVDGIVRLIASPGTVLRDVPVQVCGDVVAPLTTTVNGVEVIVDDCESVKDKLTFKVPENLPPGVYSIRVIMPNNTGRGNAAQYVSTEQFINVLPSADTCFQMSTEKLEALEESGLDFTGSDEADIRTLATPIGPDLVPRDMQSVSRRFSDADSGEVYESFDEVVFTANNISAVAVSIIGFEVDNEEAFRRQITDFIDAYELVVKSNLQLLASSIGTLGAAVALALGLGALWATAIGAAITLAISIGLALWAPADPIIEDFLGLSLIQLAQFTSVNFPAPPTMSYKSPGDIDVTAEPVEKTTQYIERRSYRNGSDTHYRITLRYNTVSPFLCP